MNTTTAPDDLGFDPDALRAKYRAERDRRLRTEGNEQYVEVTGKFAHFVDDPYVEPIEREALTDTVEVLIIGGGFGGLLAGARLRDAGVEDLRIIEKGGDFGGTWYWNRYPGAQCDIESYIYLPLLEEVGYVPKEKYSHAPEILAHSRAIAEKYRLYDNACFQTEVTDMRWDDAAQVWLVGTNRGDQMKARFVCMSNGPLNRPKLPAFPASRASKATRFTRADGTTAIRAVTPTAISRACAASVSASSAPAQPPCSVCRTWVKLPISSMFFSARRRQSTFAVTSRPKTNGRAA